MLFHLAEKPVAERERILQGNPRFREMSPRAQDQFRERLQRISEMTPDERQRLRERFEIFHRLSAESRDQIREEVIPAWNRLPLERRRVLLDELRILRELPPAEREQRLSQESVSRQFSADEARILRQLGSIVQEDMHPFRPRP